MVSQRARDTAPFLAMEVLERASGREDVVHLEVGEPAFEPPEPVIEAAVDSLRSGDTDYTAARGKPALRQAIARRYDRRYGVDVDPERIFVTPGSSPALLLSMASLVDPGETVVLSDPHYASYPAFVSAVDGEVRTVPHAAEDGFQPDLAAYERAIDADTAAVVVNSPANPTGATVEGKTLASLASTAEAAGATLVSDEIYHGLSYDATEHTALEYTDDAFVLDGFSKRYGMTGWRLGWAVVPPTYVEAMNRLAQHTVICAPSFVQDAGIAALETPPERLAEIRDTYRERRDLLLEAVADWGLDAGYTPDGAYYLLVDVSGLPGDSLDVAELFLEEAAVAVTPGVDFGEGASDYLRLSYAAGTEEIREGIRRIDDLLAEFDV